MRSQKEIEKVIEASVKEVQCKIRTEIDKCPDWYPAKSASELPPVHIDVDYRGWPLKFYFWDRMRSPVEDAHKTILNNVL